MNKKRHRVERELTADDWKALWLVMRLAQEVAFHGRKALLPFAQAIVAGERPGRER